MKQKMNSMRIKSKGSNFLVKLFIYSILVYIVFLILYPLIRNAADMFKSQSDLMDKSVAFIAKEPTLERIQQTMAAMDYWKTILNTGLLSLLTASVQVISAVMIGYGLARFRFALRGPVFILVIFTMIVPLQILMPSYYVSFQKFDFWGLFSLMTGSPLRLLNTAWPFVILGITGLGFKSGLFIYLSRQFFCNMPIALEEAARIDGAGYLRTFGSIMLPNARTIIVTIFLFSFSWQWTDSYQIELFMPGKEYIATVISKISEYGTAFGMDGVVVAAMVTTGVVLAVIPLLIVYVFLQRYFIEGIERSGLVG